MTEENLPVDAPMSESTPDAATHTSNGQARKIQRVTPSMVASARAQIVIAEQLGTPVAPAIRKIAAVPLAG